MKNILYFLAIYLPFEEFLLKWLPVNETVYTVLRQFPDLVVFSLLIIVILNGTMKANGKIKNFSFIILLILFVSYGILLVYINNSNLFYAISNIKVLIRYIFLIFIVQNININEKDIQKLFKIILYLGIIQAIIGILEISQVDAIRSFFAPREVMSVTGKIKYTALRKEDAAFGTMAYTINYAYFLLIALIINLHQKYFKYKTYLITFVILIAIFFSGSRTAFLLAGIFVFHSYIQNKNNKFSIIRIVLVFLLIIIFFLTFLGMDTSLSVGNNNDDFLYFLSPDFFEMLQYQRLGLISLLLLNIFDMNVFIGLSSDRFHIEEYALSNLDLPPLMKLHMLDSVEDVYWVSMYFYYGFFGFILFITILIYIYKKIKNSTIRQGNIILKSLFIALVLGSFFNQLFEVRQFSYYFWLILAFFIRFKQINFRNLK